MGVPESIPEDRYESFPCGCGEGEIIYDDGFWICTKCDFKKEESTGELL